MDQELTQRWRPWLSGELIAVCCIAWCVSPAPSAEPEPAALHVKQDATTATVLVGTRPLLGYRFAEVPFKPYVQTFHTPSGVNILRDSPHDHVHHHALMFAVSVDGLDFWSEVPSRKPGRQVQRSIETFTAEPDGDVEVAGITGQVDWIDADDKLLLSEERTVTTYSGADVNASLLTWQSRLEPAPGKDMATLTGAHYVGLGIRFVESMDRVGRFVSATGKPGVVFRGKERLTRTKWVAYVAPAGGKTVTVAMFDHPQNPRHPATMFTMPEHFAYISVTLGLHKEPLTIQAGKPVVLRYGVAVWDGEVDAAAVERLYSRWVRLAGEDRR